MRSFASSNSKIQMQLLNFGPQIKYRSILEGLVRSLNIGLKCSHPAAACLQLSALFTMPGFYKGNLYTLRFIVILGNTTFCSCVFGCGCLYIMSGTEGQRIHSTRPCSHISTHSDHAHVFGERVCISRRAEIGEKQIVSATAA